jgi:hypothetical protein
VQVIVTVKATVQVIVTVKTVVMTVLRFSFAKWLCQLDYDWLDNRALRARLTRYTFLLQGWRLCDESKAR